jgi:DNA helicase-2/ATP-dependent DNA helicase PcrA
MAILVRAGFQTREFEERLILLGIPYRIVGAVRFYERLEIKDALAYLRAVAHPDDSLAFERLLNTPKRGLGPSFLQTLHQTSRERSVSLFRAAEFLAETNQVRGAARLALQGLVKDLCRWSQELSVRPLGEVVAMILDESGYTGFWKKENSPEATGRLENLKELVRVVQEFETLQSFLEHVSLVTEQISAPGEEMLSIMTLHMAKGLEFETVFLAGWEEGLFPSPKTLEEHGEKGLEEERRLAYVGLTRAKKRVTVSFARNRRFYQGWQQASPSRFINEFPQEHIEANLGAGAQNSHFRKNWSSSKDFSNASFMEIEGDVFQGNDDVDSFKKGDVVFHQTFGRGVVRSSAGAHLEIAFGTDVKKIISRFISRQV